MTFPWVLIFCLLSTSESRVSLKAKEICSSINIPTIKYCISNKYFHSAGILSLIINLSLFQVIAHVYSIANVCTPSALEPEIFTLAVPIHVAPAPTASQ